MKSSFKVAAITLWIILFTGALFGAAHAQLTQPTPKKPKGPTSTHSKMVGRPLPPSMQAELAKDRGTAAKKIVYRDTVKGSQLQSALSRDTSMGSDSLFQLAHDSAEAVIDSTVSEPHKAHLDSMILELPEFTGTLDRPHFDYPLSIMTEPYRTLVEFDSTIVGKMNPITRERLPYFDQHPIPLPLEMRSPRSGWIEVGAGVPKFPSLAGGYSAQLSNRWSTDLEANFLHNGSANPVSLLWALRASATGALVQDPSPDLNSTIALHFATTGRQVSLWRDTLSSPFQSDYLLLQHTFGAEINGGLGDKSGYHADLGASFLSDNSTQSLSQDHEWLGLSGNVGFGRSDFGVVGSFQLDHVGAESTPLRSGTPIAASGLVAQSFALRLTNHGTSGIDWSAGLTLFSGSDIEAASTIRLLPSATISMQINPRWTIGAAFLPQAQLLDHAALSAINPFWSPLAANEGLRTDSVASVQPLWRYSATDPRRVALDVINLHGFTSYTLTADDEIRADVELVDRDRDVIFYEHSLDSSHSSFYTMSGETRRFSASVTANLLLFTKDILTASFRYSSATVVGSDAGVPFEPSLRIHAEYRLRSLLENVVPAIQFDHVARSARSVSLVGLSGTVELSAKSAILVRLENLLGGASDYWSGYQEMPRSVWAAFRYSF